MAQALCSPVVVDGLRDMLGHAPPPAHRPRALLPGRYPMGGCHTSSSSR